MQNIELKPHELPYEVNEEIKYLRANIQFCGTDKKVILVTSSFRGEGKSTICLNLAKSMAEMGKRVLLVDADLRRSMLKRDFVSKGKVKNGLTHYLSGMAELFDVLTEIREPFMYIIFAGPVPPNPSELLSNSRVDELLKWAREQFDYVIIDSAPLGMVSDAASLVQKCDGAAVVIEAGKIPYKIVQNVTRQLQDANCPVLGVILNKVDQNSGNRYYSKYNKYYSKYQRG